ncbi:hypothetical protein JQ596_36945 [Bradyrhizobium manausense]|uniref:hypothetical protein n=1 Tax=Bradyrhizobium TaxID=374 RepID=UPI001BAC7A3D|nr:MULTISPECIES: hypothetical protein [Bradyrhizobium]MBR0831111.1 hypothetical protein [Bradyrhizobium manausense]UVO29146.1 hypothetical protein KUF59_43190 [Bradyrhizobium arachidis]
MTEHAVIIRFRYGSTNLDRLFELEGQLDAAISKAEVGEYDGNEIAVDGSDGSLYMYGPDADRLFAVVEPIIRAHSFMKGAQVRRRYGGAKSGAREITSTIE